MAKQTKIPHEIISRLYNTLSVFGCARWKAMLTFAECLAKTDGLPEGLAVKALQQLLESGLAEKTTYADENILLPLGQEDPSITVLNAFEAFVSLVQEAVSESGSAAFCDAGKSTEYPYHYFLNIRKHQYRLIVYEHDATARLSFLNGVYDDQKDKYYTLVLVITEAYGWEEFAELRIKGKTRIAFIQQTNAKRNTYKCTLTDVIED